MKLFLGNLTTIFQGISAIINEEIPIKTTYWLTRNADKLTSEIKLMEKNRPKLLNTYVEKDKDGKMVLNEDKKSYKIEDTVGFQNEFAKLAGMEIDIDLKVFKLEDFGNVKISMVNFMKLKPIISDLVEEKPEEKKLKGKKDNKIVKFKK